MLLEFPFYQLTLSEALQNTFLTTVDLFQLLLVFQGEMLHLIYLFVLGEVLSAWLN